MATILSVLQWIEILQDKDLTRNIDLDIFQSLYSFEGNKAPASQIGLFLGYKNKNTASPLNLEIGRYAKRIATKYDINFTVRSEREFKFWDLFFNGWDEAPYFIWQLKPELKQALEETGLTGEEQYPEEIPIENQGVLSEGSRKTVLVNTYERNPKARQKCIEYWKAVCAVCDFDFEKKYGELGAGFIHVHHLIPVSQIGKTYLVDPINDLRPVCPNCHAMLHRMNPPIKLEDLKAKILS